VIPEKNVSVLFYSMNKTNNSLKWRLYLPFDKYIHCGLKVDDMIFSVPVNRNDSKAYWLSSNVSNRVWGKPDMEVPMGSSDVSWDFLFQYSKDFSLTLFSQIRWVYLLRSYRPVNCTTYVQDYLEVMGLGKYRSNTPNSFFKELMRNGRQGIKPGDIR